MTLENPTVATPGLEAAPPSSPAAPPSAPGAARCWREGARRVHGAPAIVGAVWALSLLLALPLGLVLRGMIRDSLGASLAADAAAEGVNYDWWHEFIEQASGVGATFVPAIVGYAAPLKNLSDLIDNQPLAATLAAAVTVWLLLWAFISGGIIDRYARGRTTYTPGFFSACGVFFFRFLRLGVLAGAAYWFLFAYFHPWLFEGAYVRWTRDVNAERDAFVVRLLLYVLFAAGLAAINLVFDYAKIRAVVEDRRSMVGALAAGSRFVAHHPRATMGLYLLNTLVFAAILLVYRPIAPGAGWSGAGVWLAFAIVQAYIVARVWAKLVFLASQIALFQSRLAHAGYAAFPERRAFDPPTVEALGPPPVAESRAEGF
jgi:hypothetical protein